MVSALLTELHLRKNFLEQSSIETIYFGGGTPSILTKDELGLILSTIQNVFEVPEGVEVTLEANPDDIHEQSLTDWSDLGINRLSLGIQTFDDGRLAFLNRSHNAKQAEVAIQKITDSFINNWSADLIFGIPPEQDSMERFQADTESLMAAGPTHISLYHLTIEPKTVFGNWYQKNKLLPVSENSAADQFQWAHEMMTGAGYDHYEVSNFARPGYYSAHNQSYWKGHKYLGIGPGAHSFDGAHRSFTVESNALYVKAIAQNEWPHTHEPLSETEQYNEYILMRLRTQLGIDVDWIQSRFGIDLRQKHCELIGHLVEKKQAFWDGSVFKLTPEKGFAIADAITLEFFIDE